MVEYNRKLDIEVDFIEDEEEGGESKTKDTLTLDEIIVKKYKLGMNLTKIMHDHNISSGSLYNILNRNRVPLRNGRHTSKSQDRVTNMSQMEKKSLISDYLKGMTLIDIYKKYDINKHGCYQILDEAGVPRRQDVDLADSSATYEPREDMVNNIKDSVKNKDTGIKISEPSPAKEAKARFNLDEGNLQIDLLDPNIKSVTINLEELHKGE